MAKDRLYTAKRWMAKEVVLIKLATVCSGIGSPEQALKDLNIQHEVIFACEIDKYARKSYEAIHEANHMFEDMTSDEFHSKAVYSDLFIGGIPCQAFSLAGKRLGELDKRGLLFYDFYKYVKNQQPKVFIIENVKGLLSMDNGKVFQNWQHLLGDCVNGHRQMFNHPDSLGYNLYWNTLNTKDFGLPQNRERVFLVGIRPDVDDNTFRFPIGWKLDKRLKDVLESEVDEKYYLSQKIIDSFTNKKGDFNGRFEPKNCEDIGNCLTARYYKMAVTDNYIQVKEATKKGFAIAEPYDSINLSNPNSETRRGRVGKQLANTLDTACNQAVVEPLIINPLKDKTEFGWHFEQNVFSDESITRALKSSEGSGNKQKVILNSRIRRLTPLECWRLQGFPDEAFYKAKEVNSDTRLYQQAGNSISTPVIGAILKNLIHLL